jgi:hypothetical protein
LIFPVGYSYNKCLVEKVKANLSAASLLAGKGNGAGHPRRDSPITPLPWNPV